MVEASYVTSQQFLHLAKGDFDSLYCLVWVNWDLCFIAVVI